MKSNLNEVRNSLMSERLFTKGLNASWVKISINFLQVMKYKLKVFKRDEC